MITRHILKHVVTLLHRFYNHPSQCQLNTTSSFHSWRAGHCFVTGDSSSFMMTEDGHENMYSDSKCSKSGLVHETVLNTACEAIGTTDNEDSGSVTALRSMFTVYYGGEKLHLLC